MAGCAEQQIRTDAQTALRAGRYTEAIHRYEAGLVEYPKSPTLRAGLLQAREESISRALSDAASARAHGRFEDSEAILRRALAESPGHARIKASLDSLATERRQRKALADAESLVKQQQWSAASKVVTEALHDDPRQSDLLALQRRIDLEQRQTQLKALAQGVAETRTISLDFRDASLRTVLDVVSRNSGLNFILDKDIRSDTRVTVFIRSAKVEDAIDLIANTYQLAKKVIDSRTLLIYPNTPEKQREHQDQVVKVFYLANGDAKGAAAFLKSMLKLRDPYVDERANMLALRDSQDNIQLAERLVSLYDTAEPEVLLEVEVIEINTTRLTELGVKFPDSFSLTLLPPSGQSGLTLGNVRPITRDRIGLNIDGVTVNLNRTTGDFNTLASPRIRVRSKEKAKILVGDKVPLITATTSGVGGFVSDSVNYIDVGLKLEVEPIVYVDDDVAIKLGLEVSSLGTVLRTNSGTTAYQIGTRNANTLLRLRDGETQLLAGLISREDRNDASKLPGLGDLPIAGRLFSSQRDDSRRTELVLSITPHIIRNVRRPDASESELWVGTEAMPRLRPVGGIRLTTDDASAANKLDNPTTAARAAVVPDTAIDSASASGSATPPPVISLDWSGPAEVKVGDPLTLNLSLSSNVPLRGAPLQITYNREQLQLIDIDEGEWFRQGGAGTSFTKTIDSTAGQARVGILRNQADGASGKGRVVSLRFKALNGGAAQVQVQSVEPLGVGGPVGRPAALPTWNGQVR